MSNLVVTKLGMWVGALLSVKWVSWCAWTLWQPLLAFGVCLGFLPVPDCADWARLPHSCVHSGERGCHLLGIHLIAPLWGTVSVLSFGFDEVLVLWAEVIGDGWSGAWTRNYLGSTENLLETRSAARPAHQALFPSPLPLGCPPPS